MGNFFKDNLPEILQIGGCVGMLAGTAITPFATRRYLAKESMGFNTNGEKLKAMVECYWPVAVLSAGGATSCIVGGYLQHTAVKTLRSELETAKSDLAIATTMAASASSAVNEYRKYVESKEGAEAAKDIHKQIVEKTAAKPETIPYAADGVPQYIDLHKVYRCIDSEGMEWHSTYYQILIDLWKINDLLHRQEYLSMGDIWAEFGADPNDVYNRADSEERGYSWLDGPIEIDLSNIVTLDPDTGELYLVLNYRNRPVPDYRRY